MPVLLLGGWQDIFLKQTLQQYGQLRRRGVDVALTVGPWTHTQMLSKGLATCARESLDWLDTYLGDGPTLRRPSRVRVYVTGQGWRHLSDWPPTTGGPLLSRSGGYRDDSRLALRDDVLAFTSATLTHDLCVYGNPVVELAHTSDNAHVDLFVRVSEVDAKGRSRNVSDGYRRLGAATKTVNIELDGIAHRFRAGSRIRLLIAGSWFPRYARNLGTEEPMLTGRQSKPATHTVRYGRSRLLLPVGPLDLSSNSVTDSDSDLG